jgi:hypothetical protein
MVLDALGRESVHHAQDATPGFRLGQNNLGGIGRRTKDAADFRHHFQCVQHVQRVEAVTEEHDEGVPRSDGGGVFLRQFDHGRVGARPADEALAGRLAEGESELDARHGGDEGLVDVLD